MTIGEKAGTHPNTDIMKSQTDVERCQSHRVEGSMDETETVNLKEIGGIGVKLAVETDDPLILALEEIEIGLVSRPLPWESLVEATDKMVPNWPHLPLVLKFQIPSLLSSWEDILEHWRTSRSLRWSGLIKPNVYPPPNHSDVIACNLTKSNHSSVHFWFCFFHFKLIFNPDIVFQILLTH